MKKTNQRDSSKQLKLHKLHNFWPFMQIRQQIQELDEEYGVHVRFKSERGTSKHCPLCREEHKNGCTYRGMGSVSSMRKQESHEFIRESVKEPFSSMTSRKPHG